MYAKGSYLQYDLRAGGAFQVSEVCKSFHLGSEAVWLLQASDNAAFKTGFWGSRSQGLGRWK